MNFSDITSWAVGQAHFNKRDDEQIYVVPTFSDKPIKVAFEDDSQDTDWTEVYGGPGNQRLLRWAHADVFIYDGVLYGRYPSVPQIDTATVDELL